MDIKKKLDEKKTQTKYEEMEQVEEYGDARDFVEGAAAGATIVAAVATVVTLT